MADTFDLARFTATDMVLCGGGLRRSTEGSATLEEAASRVAAYLRDSLTDATGAPACVLVRFYRTLAFGDLDPGLQRFAISAAAGETLLPETRCLTLLGTAGAEAAWNSRLGSTSHRAIPLPSAGAVARLPMVSRLLTQLGVQVAGLAGSDHELVMETGNLRTGVFHVQDAEGSPYVPDQEGFVRPYGVRSVVGFGGSLASGDIYAVVLFSRVSIPRAAATLFKHLGGDTKMAILPSLRQPIFAASGPPG